jgi:hypothetical protein
LKDRKKDYENKDSGNYRSYQRLSGVVSAVALKFSVNPSRSTNREEKTY